MAASCRACVALITVLEGKASTACRKDRLRNDRNTIVAVVSDRDGNLPLTNHFGEKIGA